MTGTQSTCGHHAPAAWYNLALARAAPACATPSPVQSSGKRRGASVKRHAQPSGKTETGLSEDVLERLRQAEQEAQKLREELAEAKAKARAEGVAVPEQVQPQKPQRTPRITGDGLRREGLFTPADENNWLREADFFARGPSEGESSGGASTSSTDAATVQRRLVIGLGLTAAAAAFALVPTNSLRGKPSKPLFFYLVPLIRIQGLLDEAEGIASDANWEELEVLLSRIQGSPNNARDNLISAFSSLDDQSRRNQAEQLAYDLLEYLAQVDYNKYYDAMATRGRISGQQQQEYVNFSTQSIKAAQAKLQQYLALMPAEALEAARQQASAVF